MKHMIASILCFLLISGLWAVNASSANFNLDSFHMGMTGANQTSANFVGRSTLTYQQTGNKNATTFHFFGNIGWFKLNISAPSAISELLQIMVTYPYTGSTLGVKVSNCHLIISIETNATNASTVNQNVSIWTGNGSGAYPYLLNSYTTTELNHSFNISVPANMVNNSVRINATSHTIGTYNTSNNVSITITETSFCSGGSDNSYPQTEASIILVIMAMMTGWYYLKGYFDLFKSAFIFTSILISACLIVLFGTSSPSSASGMFEALFFILCVVQVGFILWLSWDLLKKAFKELMTY